MDNCHPKIKKKENMAVWWDPITAINFCLGHYLGQKNLF